MEDDRIPVTIITGFLGAGKTTLLNNLIKKHPKRKFAVIENEIGSINIDSDLIVGASENIFELSNGCICCSLNNDFTTVVESLLESKYNFDHLLVETTGIADPLSIVKKFIEGERIQHLFRIESVVCVADAQNIEDSMTEQMEVLQQLALSDDIVVNKMDTVSAAYAQTLLQKLAHLNPMAQIHATSFGNIDRMELTQTFAYDALMLEQSVKKFVVTKNASKQHLLEPKVALKHNITAMGFEFDRPFDIEKFSTWVRNFLYFNKTTVFRAKGILAFDDMPERYIFHAVRGSFVFEVGAHWAEQKPQSKIVFIGKSLNESEMQNNLEKLLIKEALHK